MTLASYQEKFVLTENKEGDFHKGKYDIWSFIRRCLHLQDRDLEKWYFYLHTAIQCEKSWDNFFELLWNHRLSCDWSRNWRFWNPAWFRFHTADYIGRDRKRCIQSIYGWINIHAFLSFWNVEKEKILEIVCEKIEVEFKDNVA